MKKTWTGILLATVLLTGCGTQAGSIGKQTQTQNTVTNIQSSGKIETYYTRAGDHPDKHLESVIDTANNHLYIAIYSLTNKGIVDSIANAKKRGVDVKIITDEAEAKNKSQASELHYLEKFGIPIKINSHSGLMHMKITDVDGQVKTTGSFNYSQQASTQNDEELDIIHDPANAQLFENEFNQMWNDASNYVDYR